MKDKKIFKKWWFWLIVVVVLGGIGSLGQSGKDASPSSSTDSSQQAAGGNSNATTLPTLNADDYKGKEGLVVYKELKAKGYTVSAEFEKQALTDINGKASDLFEPLDPSKTEDKQSVDAFIVGNLAQNGDSVMLTIAKSSN